MNKKLIALAVAGACVAPAAMAQTANPVTLYGRIYATFESVEAKGGATPVPRRNRVSDQSSLLGVRGTEDLGGGLKAFFQLETGFRPDQQPTVGAAGSAIPVFNRNSGVGLQGSWGSILMGRWDTPFKTTTIAVDPFGDLTIGGITSALNDRTNFDRREQNAVQYWSPDFGGFAARLHYTANEGKTTTTDPSVYGASLTYTKGPVYLVYAYEKHKDPSTTVQKEEGNAFGGTFTIGPVKLGAIYEEFTKTATKKQKSYMANIVWTIAGPHQLIYQYQNSKDGGANTAATQPECDVNTVGYQYNFSRRTFFLAQYSKSDNNTVATCNFGANTLAITAGQDPTGVSLGLRHVF